MTTRPGISHNSVASRVSRRILAGAPVLLALALGACVDSSAPLLTDAAPLLGQKLRVHIIPVGKDQTDPHGDIIAYAWNGTRYEPIAGAKGAVRPFTIHYFGRDYIAQGFPTPDTIPTMSYALIREAAEGVYVMSEVDEHDLDEATRAKLCDRAAEFTCRISSAEALAQIARATAKARRQPSAVLLLRGEQEQASK
jgi:hypothetical protein